MEWKDALENICKTGAPLLKEVLSGHATLDSIWSSSEFKAARDALMGLLQGPDQVTKMIEASDKLREEARGLLAKEKLTPAEFERLDLVSALAYRLSADALHAASKPKQIFFYTMEQVIPLLLKLFDIVITVFRGAKKTKVSGDRFLQRDLLGDRVTLDLVTEIGAEAQAPPERADPLLLLVEAHHQLCALLAAERDVTPR